jgi:hypothetical protein
MTSNEFMQQALIHVGAALVKCYDEQADGIIGDSRAAESLSYDAINIAAHLRARADEHGLFDEEDEEE